MSDEKLKNTLVQQFSIEEKFVFFKKLFLEYNAHTNLMSKNDEIFLDEKHIFDSLQIELVLNKYFKNTKSLKLLDIGAGGGFPSIPIAIKFENVNVLSLDSINKKINFIDEIKKELKLKNIETKCERAEKFMLEKPFCFDIVSARAVSSLDLLLKYAIPFLKGEGLFVAYKSSNYQEELEKAQKIMKKLNVKLFDKIEYELPTKEQHKRVLLIFKKIKT